MGSSGRDFTSIQAAVDSASSGATILVDSGTYYESVNVNKPLTIIGVDTGKGKPVIDAIGQQNGFNIDNVANVVIDGFIIKDAWGAGVDLSNHNLRSYYTPTILGDIIRNCTISDNGIGVNILNESGVQVLSNNITGNGVGISATYTSKNVISGNLIANNRGNGFQLLCIDTSDGSPTFMCTYNVITDNRIENNNGDGILLAIWCYLDTITGNIIDNNNNNGIHLTATTNSEKIQRNIIYGNHGDGINLEDLTTNNFDGVKYFKLVWHPNGNTITDNYIYDNGGVSIRNAETKNNVSGNIFSAPPAPTPVPSSTPTPVPTPDATIVITQSPSGGSIGSYVPATVGNAVNNIFNNSSSSVLPGVPDKVVTPVASIVTGIALIGIWPWLWNLIMSILSRLFDFLSGGLKVYLQGQYSAVDKRLRGVRAVERVPLLFGLSSQEIMVGLISAVLLGAAIAYANGQLFILQSFVLLVFIAGFTAVIHEIAHRYFAYRYKASTEYKFWDAGAVTLIVTALLNQPFATPARTIINDVDKFNKKTQGIIFLVGPIASILLSIGFLLLVIYGNGLESIGKDGFRLSMMACVYQLIPLNPLEGKMVFSWNRWVWALVFLPALVIYLGVLFFL